MRTHKHPVAAGLVGGLDDQVGQIGQHVLQMLRVGAAPGRHVRDDRVLGQVVADDVRHVGIDDLVIGDA